MKEQQTFYQKSNVIKRVFLKGYTYSYQSEVDISLDNQTGSAIYKFSIICNDYNSDGYNMTMVLEELKSKEDPNGINFLEQIKNFTRDITEYNNTKRFLQ